MENSDECSSEEKHKIKKKYRKKKIITAAGRSV